MDEFVRNAWYPAAWSRDVKRELISRRILEEDAPTRMRQMVENRIKAEVASARASDASAA
jgi:hypothetical protein